MQTATLTYPAQTDMDYKLAFHCAPALAGIKPANLMALRQPEGGAIRIPTRQFGARDIFFYRIAQRAGRMLLLVYNRVLLEGHLRLPENLRLLERHGYSAGMLLGEMLARLARRIRAQGDYPHEIGVFLGYPPEDVEGFIAHEGRDFTLCGYWKVYGDPAQAKALFSAYDRARGYYCTQVLGGEKIHNIVYGGTTQ